MKDQWYIQRNYGSDDCFYWGTEKEAKKWTELTGSELELYSGKKTDSELSSEQNSYNLQDEFNNL